VGSFRIGAWSETGVRKRNEDYQSVDIDRQILIIADGMGGHSSGDDASREAVAAAMSCLRQAESVAPAISQSILDAQEAVSQHGDNRGTTLSVVAIEEDQLYIGHVGDTRVYVNGTQITRDQGTGHVLEEFVGGDYAPLMQSHVVSLKPKSWVVMTSDGIHDVLPISDIIEPLTTACQENPEDIARMLAFTAIQSGSQDNCTAIVAEYTLTDRTETEHASQKAESKKS